MIVCGMLYWIRKLDILKCCVETENNDCWPNGFSSPTMT